MADLEATDVTITIGQGDVDQLTFNKMVFPTIAFGDASLTYPSGGIPLPSVGNFDFYQQIRFAPDVLKAGYLYHVDIANHKLMIYYADYDADADGALIEFAGAPAATEIKMCMVGQ